MKHCSKCGGQLVNGLCRSCKWIDVEADLVVLYEIATGKIIGINGAREAQDETWPEGLGFVQLPCGLIRLASEGRCEVRGGRVREKD